MGPLESGAGQLQGIIDQTMGALNKQTVSTLQQALLDLIEQEHDADQPVDADESGESGESGEQYAAVLYQTAATVKGAAGRLVLGVEEAMIEEARRLDMEVKQYDILLKRARLEAMRAELEKLSPKKTTLSSISDQRDRSEQVVQGHRRDMLKIIVPDFRCIKFPPKWGQAYGLAQGERVCHQPGAWRCAGV